MVAGRKNTEGHIYNVMALPFMTPATRLCGFSFRKKVAFIGTAPLPRLAFIPSFPQLDTTFPAKLLESGRGFLRDGAENRVRMP